MELRLRGVVVLLCAVHLIVAVTAEAQVVEPGQSKDHPPARVFRVRGDAPARLGASAEPADPSAETSKANSGPNVKTLAAEYVKRPSTANLKRLTEATAQKLAQTSTKHAEQQVDAAKKEQEEQSSALEHAEEAAASNAKEVEQQEDEVAELQKVLKSISSPQEQAKFEQKLSAAQTALEQSKKKLSAAQRDEDVAKKKVKAAKLKKVRAEGQATMVAAGATTAKAMVAAGATPAKPSANATSATSDLNQRIGRLEDLDQTEALDKELQARSKQINAALEETGDGEKTETLKKEGAEVQAALDRVNDKARVFKAEAETAAANKRRATAESEAEKQADAAADAKEAEQELSGAKQEAEKAEKKVAKQQEKLQKEQADVVAKENMKAKSAMDGALATEEKAEVSALEKAKKSGDAKKLSQMVEMIEKTKLEEQKRKEQEKVEEEDVAGATKALREAQATYSKEKLRAEQKIADESPTVGGESAVQQEISRLEEASRRLITESKLDQISTPEFAYSKINGASKTIAAAKESITSMAVREVVGIAKDSKRKAERVLKKTQLSIRRAAAHGGLDTLTKLATEAADKDLGEVQSQYDEAMTKLGEAHATASAATPEFQLRAEQQAATQAELVRKLKSRLVESKANAASVKRAHHSATTETAWKAHDKQTLEDTAQSMAAAHEHVKQTTSILSKLIGSLKDGDMDGAKHASQQMERTVQVPVGGRKTDAQAPSLTLLKQQISELGEIAEAPRDIATQVTAKGKIKPREIQETLKQKQVTGTMEASTTSVPHEGPSEAELEAGQQSLHVALEKLKDAKAEFSKVKQRMDDARQVAEAGRKQTAAALEARLADEEVAVKMANEKMMATSEVAAQARRVVRDLSDKKKANMKAEALEKANLQAAQLHVAESKHAQSILGDKAADTLAKLQAVEKSTMQGVLEAKTVAPADAKHLQEMTQQRVASIQTFRSQLAEELIDLREAADKTKGLQNVSEKTKVELNKPKAEEALTGESPEQQADDARASMIDATRAHQHAKDEYDDALERMKATRERLQDVRAHDTAKAVEDAAKAKQAEIKKAAETEAQVGKLTATKMKQDEIAAASALALNLERQKAQGYKARAQATAKRAAKLTAKAHKLEERANSLSKPFKEQADAKKRNEIEQDQRKIKEAEKSIEKAKSREKSAEKKVEGAEAQKKSFAKDLDKEKDLAQQLEQWKVKRDDAQDDEIQALKTRKVRKEQFQHQMIAYALKNIGPESKMEEEKLQDELEKSSPAHAKEYSHHDPKSLRVQVAASKKRIADLHVHKAELRVRATTKEVHRTQSKLEDLAKKNAKARVSNAKDEEHEIRQAEKLQRKAVAVEKKEYKKIVETQKQEEKIKSAPPAEPYMLKHLQKQAAAARVVAMKVQAQAKTESEEAETALQGLKDSLKQALNQGQQIQKKASDDIKRRISDTKKGLPQAEHRPEQVSEELRNIRDTAANNANNVREGLRNSNNAVVQRMKQSQKLVDEISSDVDNEELQVNTIVG